MDDSRREGPTAEELLARGEYRAAIERALEQYGKRLYSICKRVLRDDAMTQDALQDAFLQAYRDIRTLKDPTKLWPWLRRIAMNRVLDRIERRDKARDRHDDDDDVVERVPAPGDGPHEHVSGARLHQALIECLDELSGLVRMSLTMRYYEQLSYAEMADATSTKVDAHTARVARALPALRECLESKGWTHG